MYYMYTLGLPKIDIPLIHRTGFSIINHPFRGTTILGILPHIYKPNLFITQLNLPQPQSFNSCHSQDVRSFCFTGHYGKAWLGLRVPTASLKMARCSKQSPWLICWWLKVVSLVFSILEPVDFVRRTCSEVNECRWNMCLDAGLDYTKVNTVFFLYVYELYIYNIYIWYITSIYLWFSSCGRCVQRLEQESDIQVKPKTNSISSNHGTGTISPLVASI